MNDSCEVIILNVNEYKENDVLINVLSLTYGYMTFIAKGLNKADSRNRSACLPYTVSQFMFDYKENGLQLLHSATLIKSYHMIQDDLAKMSVMSVISELMEYLVKDNTYDLELIHDVYASYKV
ncbi:MAG: DNA repair protein RecO, partial [Erysipelotrichaceae bacterium]